METVRRKLGAPAVHEVLLNADYNAGITQVPRLGILGWQKNYLTLGLPLLASSKREHFLGTLAHELGHISGSHGKFNGWVYRMRLSWLRLQYAFDHDQDSGWSAGLTRLVTQFYGWYAPIFSAYGFVLIRAHEYAADESASSVVGERVNADDLMLFHLRGRRHSTYFRDLWEKANHDSNPPTEVYSGLFENLREPLVDPKEPANLITALDQKTGDQDSHPCLNDRVRAMNIAPPATITEANQWIRDHGGAIEQSAADYYFGESTAKWTAVFDSDWTAQYANSWKEAYQQRTIEAKRLEELDEKAAQQPLELEQAWEHASLVGDIRGAEAAETHFRHLIEREPEHAGAHYQLGLSLLAKDDDAGVDHLQRAMNRDNDSTEVISEIIAGYYLRRSKMDEYVRFVELGRKASIERKLATAERFSIKKSDELSPHGLDDGAVEQIRSVLRTTWGVKDGFLVRRQFKHEGKPSFALVLIRKNLLWTMFKSDERTNQEFVNEIVPSLSDFPHPLIVFTPGWKFGLRWKLHRINGARIY